MKNPLRKRYLRELRSDLGKYLVIALFMIMLIGLVSGYLVAANSIEKTFYEGWDKYNVEDGHLTFSEVPEAEVLSQLEEKASLTLYDQEYCEEDLDANGTTLRIFKERQEVNLASLVSGEFPSSADEIALDRMFAENNGIAVGDSIVLNGRTLSVCGYVALVDYNCLYENNSDMIFNAQIFGVAVMTDEGYTQLGSSHTYASYAWKYDTAPADEAEENSRSEDLIDILGDVLKAYDTEIIQLQVNDLYARANEISDALSDEFEAASDEITEKVQSAAVQYGAAAFSQLGTSYEDFLAFQEAAENLETEMGALGISEEAPVISLDEDDSYENDMSFSLDAIRDVVDKLEKTGLYDVSRLNMLLDALDGIMNTEFSEADFLTIENYIPKYQNNSITYCMDDMSSDKPMFLLFDYIVVIIIAFVFAVTTASTIQKESGAIGTLRASGYTKGELVRHYMFLPVTVTVAASIIGNILGYTVFVGSMKAIFYNSFSLANYEPLFNPEAFVDTTVVPLILLVAINLIMLTSKLGLSPMRFLRHELSGSKNKRALRLSKKLPFLFRFGLRILFQNVSAYLVMVVGIIFGGIICVFGFMFNPMFEDYADLIVQEKICNYQYVLTEHAETAVSRAEKYCIESLDLAKEGYISDEISIYGIEAGSAYITESIPEGQVLVSNGMADKYSLRSGDSVTLDDPYSSKTYTFTVAGSYEYSAALSVFMNRSEFLECFGKDADDFTGFFSDIEITDIDADEIATVITETDLTKVAGQMKTSLGGFMELFKYFGAVMLVLLMYLMTKQVIEKNMQSIAMTKILGFYNGEIGALYLLMSFAVVLISMALMVPAANAALQWMFKSMLYTEMSGYFPFIVSDSCYIYTILLGIGCYVLVSALLFFKIGRIPKSEALKNIE